MGTNPDSYTEEQIPDPWAGRVFLTLLINLFSGPSTVPDPHRQLTDTIQEGPGNHQTRVRSWL